MTSPAAPDTSIDAELEQLADQASSTVTRWLETSRALATPHASAERLSAVLSDPRGLEFTVGFVDRVIRTEDRRAAARALADLGSIAPATLSRLDRAQITAGAFLGRAVPDVVVPAARARMRQMVGHMVVDARDEPLGRAVATLTAGGHRLNINLLGEAVLGQAEADHHLEETRRLLARPDVDYVSIKVSSISSQLSMWGFEETVEMVLERLRPLYREAAAAPAGTKFLNLDMEEYRDLRLTMEVFQRLLSEPELEDLEAGIVIQAYLPDALGAIQELSAFATERIAGGGAGIKVRLVKGANLAMERVHAEEAGWPLATCASKEATDANYKLVLHWLFTPARMAGLRIGVAGHNLFDIAFAHLLSVSRGVEDRTEFEMLQGMAAEQAEALSRDVGDLLLYVPAVRPAEFDVAISYLVRRLEENAAAENFMSGIFDLEPGNEIFDREESRFRTSLELLRARLEEHGDEAPGANHLQDRTSEESLAVGGDTGEVLAFANEPDTNPALQANQDWARAAIERSAQPGWLEAQAVPPSFTVHEVDDLVATTRVAAEAWAARPAIERAEILCRAADIMAARRGRLVSIAAAEVGKSVAQSDPEISEAIDFARYYAHQARELERIEGATFTPDRVIVVTPPWNFPLAIPTGSTVAALAAGAGVIHKPSKPSKRCSAAILEALWDAGVPREVLRGIYPDEREVGRKLISHPQVDRVILTGASETAAMFASWRPELQLSGETSGKNALVVTPAADRDLAVADLVSSAFGHAGQKCSAASLGILVGSVASSERFRRQLVDAASSMVVDWPTNLPATIGPLTEEPSTKLKRALTTLEPGETWLLKPRRLDDTGRLWSPGIKDGVKPGSFFHLTECFGPVLGLMHASDLDEAIAWQNATDFGLTGGIHSLDTAEVRRWVERVEVGNAYVNRGITGAIVQRQPFGGWKKSSVGLGSKAGGPNYLMLMGSWADAPVPVREARPSGAAADLLTRLGPVLAAGDHERLAAIAADDAHWWASEFGVGHDRTGLLSEANVLRYRSLETVLRLGAGTSAHEAARVLLAAARSGSRVRISTAAGVGAEAREVARIAAQTVPGVELAGEHGDAELIETITAGRLGPSVGARVRHVGAVPPAMRERVAAHPEVALVDEAVTSSGRVELRSWLREQAVSMTLHRFGNPSSPFQQLASELGA